VLAVLALACTRTNPAFEGLPPAAAVDARRETLSDTAVAADAMATGMLDAASDPPLPITDAASADDASVDLAAPDVLLADPWNLASDLFGYWRFDETAGNGTATDHSGRGHHADLEALNPNTAWTTGHFDGALDFPASVTQAAARVRLPADANQIQQFTIAAWAFRTPIVDDRHMSILSRQITGPREVYNFTFLDDHLAAYVSDSDGGASFTSVQSEVVTPLNQWIHVAVTYDGSNIRLYLDGREIAQAPHTGALPTSTNPILIGTNRNTNNDEPMVGRLDEVLIYTRALPAGAIDALASDTRPTLP
jgi:hypothetical protein